MTNWNKIEQISKEVRETFNSSLSDFDINSGFCAHFATRMADKLKASDIEFEIKVTDNFQLEDELEGHEYSESDFGHNMSHCYILIDGFGFDAFDVSGIEEREMTYLNEL